MNAAASSRRPVGYYVHHQGAGHWQRANLIAARLDRPVTLIGTLSDIDTSGANGAILDLPDDRLSGFDGRDGEAIRPDCFHYVPVGIDRIRARMGLLAAWMAENDPALLIVDVSVEVTLLARLMSVPTLVVRLAGNRTDTPHLEAFRSAERLLAFNPPAIETAGTPDWVRAKTLYAGFLADAPVSGTADDGSIAVIYGRGGAGGSASDLAAAARAVPERHWHVLGPVEAPTTEIPSNLHLHGWVADTGPFLDRAALIVGGGGDGVVAAVATRAKRFVCLPEPRAFDEQVAKAEALAALGAAIVRPTWPDASEWPALVRAGLALDPAVIGGLVQADAIGRTAAIIEDVIQGIERRRAPRV
ncbi:glycosyltransferase [Methylobacterium marchantiae]|uniref:Glycosyltransferase n=1 Tax=Methylobacterium marchantiae TaxID=600331 RepID=A0ABW3WVR7_9HYPH|nr:hypothetical protein AIGOOFII_1306 [Methylobacterium marchantiae]